MDTPSTTRDRQRPQRCWLRRSLIALVVVGLAVPAGSLGLRFLGQNRVVEAGSIVVAIEGRHVDYSRPLRAHDPEEIGTGSAGRIGLVGDRCVGFVGDPAHPGQRDLVIVWPYGTTVSGQDEDVVIESGGQTIRLGDWVEGGRG
ncbi:MAG: hypothetical protein WC558_16750, partial [Patulibacter sp.]